MSLRPRYSLLTLLVLTALVAGGVKLWRGPHRVKLHDKPAIEYIEFLAKRPWISWLFFDNQSKTSAGDFLNHFPELAIDYEYQNDWDGKHILGLRAECDTLPNFVLKDVKCTEYALPNAYLISEHSSDDCEKIRCWICNGDEQPPVEESKQRIPATGDVFMDKKINGYPLYVITESKKIYKLFVVSWFDVTRVAHMINLNEIPDDHIRSRITEELESID